MIRICNWYREPKVLGEKEPFEDKSETHTICPECYEKFRRENIRKLEEADEIDLETLKASANFYDKLLGDK